VRQVGLTFDSLGNKVRQRARAVVDFGEFMTVTEAAEALGYTVQHTRLLLRHGKLPGEKIGRDWLVSRDGVDSYGRQRATVPLPFVASRPGRPPTGRGRRSAA